MLSPRSRIKVLTTPAFLRVAEQHPPLDSIIDGPLAILTQALGRSPAEPSWVVVEPGLSEPKDEDEGRTRKVSGPFRFWAIRDDHEAGCECGCEGASVVTFLLPGDY